MREIRCHYCGALPNGFAGEYCFRHPILKGNGAHLWAGKPLLGRKKIQRQVRQLHRLALIELSGIPTVVC